MKLYTVLRADGWSYWCYAARHKWPLPQGGEPGDWIEVKGKFSLNERGLELFTLPQLVDWLGPVIWQAQGSGDSIVSDAKIVYRRARLVRKTAWDGLAARSFACDCAERALLIDQRAGRDLDEQLWQAVQVARRCLSDPTLADAIPPTGPVWMGVDACRNLEAWERGAAREAVAWAVGAAKASRDLLVPGDAASWADAASAVGAARAAQRAAWNVSPDACEAERRWQARRLASYL